jgi:Starch synthase catalytic domain
MCNLYSLTKGQAAIVALVRAMRDRAGNLPPMPGIFPDYPAWASRPAQDADARLRVSGKAGISYSDRLTTVSPTYAREILTVEYGCGLEGMLQRRTQDLVGILNGADYQIWDPATDAHLPADFNLQNIAGKRVCKIAGGMFSEVRQAPDAGLLPSWRRRA